MDRRRKGLHGNETRRCQIARCSRWDTDQDWDNNPGTTTRAGRPTYGPWTLLGWTWDSVLKPTVGETASFLAKIALSGYPGGYLEYIRQHKYPLLTPTPGIAPPTARHVGH